jgi:uncharacterized protein (TIGR00730 family)
MQLVKNVCVFCGSHVGESELFKNETIALGRLLATEGFNLVYGGANVGLMKAVADSYMETGGYAVGIIPGFLAEKHLVQPGLDETILVSSMHERKFKMAELADAFVALPGGYGTLEELFEIITASQLALHKKPIVLGNFNGFYDHLIAHRDIMIKEGFVQKVHEQTFVSADNALEIVQALRSYKAPEAPKYVESVHKKYNH